MPSPDAQDLAPLLAALRTSEARYRDLFEQSLAGVYRSTAAGRVLECNAALARIFGYDSPEALRAVPASDLYLAPADRGRHVERLRALGAVHSGELCMRRRDGTPVWVLYSERLRRGDDGAEYIDGTLLDVTARREAEAALLQSGRTAAIGALAAGVAHGINNPLSAVLANLRYADEALARLAREAAEPGQRAAAAEAREALGDASQGVARVHEVVRQLRLFAGEAPVVEGPVEVRPVLEAALGRVAGSLRACDRVMCDLGDAPPVAAGAAPLEEALHNLLRNAAEALRARAAPAGLLRVALSATGDGRVLVTVTDDGGGMGPEVVARAFDPLHPGAPGGHAGGLGLSLARGYLGSIGAEVTLESLEGHGTTVRVLLRTHRPSP